jgi:hypothetical protein
MATASRSRRSPKATPRNQVTVRTPTTPEATHDANRMVFLVAGKGSVNDAELIHVAATAHEAPAFADGFNAALSWDTFKGQVARTGIPAIGAANRGDA